MIRSMKIVPMVLALALLVGCGGTASTTTPSTDATPAIDDGSSVADVGGDPASGLDLSATSAALPGSLATTPTATGAATTSSFVLKGLVTDTTGRALVGATISIGSQTTVSANDGTFEIDAIADTTVTVNVTLTGYQPISSYAVTFSTTAPLADKQFKLAQAATTATMTTGTTTTTTTSGTTTTTTTPNGGFTLAQTYNPAAFQSVSGMVVDGNMCYVLGEVKGLLLQHNTVAEMDATTGTEVRSFYKTSLVTYIPTSATSLSVTSGQISVSNGTNSYVFGIDGTLLFKSSGGAVPNPTTVTDTQRTLTYHLSDAAHVDVTYSGSTTHYPLPGALEATALGIDTNGDVLVLDAGKAAVLSYTFALPQ